MTAAPFDVPCPDAEIAGAYLGVAHRDGALRTELLLTPAAGEPHLYDQPDRTALLRPQVLARWLDRPEAAAITATVRVICADGPRRGPATAAYRSLLGPLRPEPERRVVLQVDCRPLAFPALMSRYGDGRDAALRYALAATRRLAAALRAEGITATARAAGELGADEAGSQLACVLGGGATGDAPEENAIESIPLAGAGLVVGAHAGQPVLLRLAGPGTGVAAVVGDDELALRIVARLAGSGVSAAVFTDRPARWSGLIEAVDDPGLLAPAAAGPARVLVDDLSGGGLAATPGHTVLRVRATDADLPLDAPRLIQHPDDRTRAVVRGRRRAVQVQLIGTADEDALLGMVPAGW